MNSLNNNLEVEPTRKSLTKEDIIEILNTDTIISLKKSVINALNRPSTSSWLLFAKGLGFSLLLFAGLIGYYVQWNTEIKQRQAETITRSDGNSHPYPIAANKFWLHSTRLVYQKIPVAIPAFRQYIPPQFDLRNEHLISFLWLQVTVALDWGLTK